MICSKHEFSIPHPDILINLLKTGADNEPYIQDSVGGRLFSVYSRKHVRASNDIKSKTINVRRTKNRTATKISLLNQIACNRF